ncbi:hypothetical protein FOL47_001491 [Perkinsus chesapeaki]|uniref:Uncharacterized protein n=1 Tax=Perkinsus chesapeaki TaxID=330153 RepID=A0A7J6MIU1_PERCH|nr:hypothetical protein FOL47_001491 [Perkinsus chesapeaki]
MDIAIKKLIEFEDGADAQAAFIGVFAHNREYWTEESEIADSSLIGNKKVKKCTAKYKVIEKEYLFDFEEGVGTFELDFYTNSQLSYRMRPTGPSVAFNEIQRVILELSPTTGEGSPKSLAKAECLQSMASHLKAGYLWRTSNRANGEIRKLLKADVDVQEASYAASPSSSSKRRLVNSEDGSSPSTSASALGAGGPFGDVLDEISTILELKEDRKGGFQIPQSTTMEAAVIGLSELIGYMVALEPTTGVEYFTDSKCTLGTIVKSGDDQHNYQIFLNQKGDVLLGAITSYLQDMQGEREHSYHTLIQNVQRKTRKWKSCYHELGDLLPTITDLSQRHMTKKLTSFIGARMKADLASSVTLEKSVYVAEHGSFLGSQLISLMERNSEKFLLRLDVLAPPSRDPVLCEISQMGEQRSKLRQFGLLELQLDQDFTIHKVQRLGFGDNSFVEYPNKLRIDLMHYFQPSSINPSSLHDDVTLCRMAIFDHLRAILKYANEVMGKSYEDLDGKEMDKVIYWEDRQHDEGQQNRKSFRVDERSDLGEALLELENAVKERKDMPCRATWESNDKSYYFEMKDSYSSEGLAQIHMITDGENDVYPINMNRRDPEGREKEYADAPERCVKFLKRRVEGTKEDKCLLSIACYVWYTQLSLPPNKGLVEAETPLPKILSSSDVRKPQERYERAGVYVHLDLTKISLGEQLVPKMYAKLMRYAQDDPLWGIALPTRERVCRIMNLKDGQRTGEMSISLHIIQKDSPDDETSSTPDVDIESTPSELSTCQKYLGDFLLKEWQNRPKTTNRAMEILRSMLKEYIETEMKDESSWSKPIPELSVYLLAPSTLAWDILEKTVAERQSEISWTVAETAADGSVIVPSFSSTNWGARARSGSSACSIEMQAGRTKGKGQVALKLASHFGIQEITGPEYTGRGSEKFSDFILGRFEEVSRLSSWQQEPLKDSPKVEFCKRALLLYLTAATNEDDDDETMLESLGLLKTPAPEASTTAGVATPDGDNEVRFHVQNDGGVISSSLKNIYEVAMESEQDCNIKAEADSLARVYKFTSTATGGVVISGSTTATPIKVLLHREISSRLEAQNPPIAKNTRTLKCGERLQDVLVRSWMSRRDSGNAGLTKRVSQKIEAEVREKKWRKMGNEYVVDESSLSGFIIKSSGLIRDQRWLKDNKDSGRNGRTMAWEPSDGGACTLATLLTRESGEDEPKHSLTLGADFTIYSIRNGDSIITDDGAIKQLSKRIAPHFTLGSFQDGTLDTKDLCRLTLVDYLVSFSKLNKARDVFTNFSMKVICLCSFIAATMIAPSSAVHSASSIDSSDEDSLSISPSPWVCAISAKTRFLGECEVALDMESGMAITTNNGRIDINLDFVETLVKPIPQISGDNPCLDVIYRTLAGSAALKTALTIPMMLTDWVHTVHSNFNEQTRNKPSGKTFSAHGAVSTGVEDLAGLAQGQAYIVGDRGLITTKHTKEELSRALKLAKKSWMSLKEEGEYRGKCHVKATLFDHTYEAGIEELKILGKRVQRLSLRRNDEVVPIRKELSVLLDAAGNTIDTPAEKVEPKTCHALLAKYLFHGSIVTGLQLGKPLGAEDLMKQDELRKKELASIEGKKNKKASRQTSRDAEDPVGRSILALVNFASQLNSMGQGADIDTCTLTVQPELKLQRKDSQLGRKPLVCAQESTTMKDIQVHRINRLVDKFELAQLPVKSESGVRLKKFNKYFSQSAVKDGSDKLLTTCLTSIVYYLGKSQASISKGEMPIRVSIRNVMREVPHWLGGVKFGEKEDGSRKKMTSAQMAVRMASSTGAGDATCTAINYFITKTNPRYPR